MKNNTEHSTLETDQYKGSLGKEYILELKVTLLMYPAGYRKCRGENKESLLCTKMHKTQCLCKVHHDIIIIRHKYAYSPCQKWYEDAKETINSATCIPLDIGLWTFAI